MFKNKLFNGLKIHCIRLYIEMEYWKYFYRYDKFNYNDLTIKPNFVFYKLFKQPYYR
jgi:hypothetical protein